MLSSYYHCTTIFFSSPTTVMVTNQTKNIYLQSYRNNRFFSLFQKFRTTQEELQQWRRLSGLCFSSIFFFTSTQQRILICKFYTQKPIFPRILNNFEQLSINNKLIIFFMVNVLVLLSVYSFQ